MTKKSASTRKPKQPKTKKAKGARRKSRALVVTQPQVDPKALPSGGAWRTNDHDQLLGDLPGIKLESEAEVIFHLQRIDPRLADAWRRDVAVHQGPITLRRVMDPEGFHGATHYAYVDHRLLWYLKHDRSDPLGARWDGYLKHQTDAPPGTIAVTVGSDIVVKKITPQLGEGA
jgi:hypothetical protein